MPLTNPRVARSWSTFVEALRVSGWVEGRNVVFDHRATEGRLEFYREFATELVALAPSVIITMSSETTEAVRKETKTIPIVMIGPGDPVGAGFIASLARPGGNITGVSNQLPDAAGKILQIIQELRPGASHIAIVLRPENPGERLGTQNFQSAAQGLGLTIEAVSVTTDAELDAALSAIALARPDALFVNQTPPMAFRSREIAAFAIEHGLITFTSNSEMVREGLLISLAPPLAYMLRRAAEIVVKILNGTKPADIPVEQPNTFEMTLNLKTAKALGLAIPPTLLTRADEVIE